MTFCYPEISGYFDTEYGKISTLVIENQSFFREVTEDICNQIAGDKGRSVIGNGGDKPLDFSKNAELLSAFVPFEINKKTLVSKITSALEREAQNGYQYDKTMSLLTEIEKYMEDISSSFDCNLYFTKITSSALIRAVGVEIADDYLSLAEKIIDYMELVREFDRDKLFFTVNLRSYIDDTETEYFMKTAIIHKYNLIMIENKEYNILENENRRIIDVDLCEI